jgi:hypothetical protein
MQSWQQAKISYNIPVFLIPSSVLFMNLIQVDYLPWKQFTDEINGVLIESSLS